MAAVINTWPKSSHILSEMIGVWLPIANQLETAMVSESLCMPECVCVCVCAGICTCIGLWASNIFGHVCLLCSASSAWMCACLGVSLSCACVSVSVFVAVSSYVSVSICISVALAHVLCAVRPKSCHCRASSDWKNWTSDPRFQHAIFAHSLKLTKINFSANNRIYTCEPTWCGDEIKTRPGQTHRLELL